MRTVNIKAARTEWSHSQGRGQRGPCTTPERQAINRSRQHHFPTIANPPTSPSLFEVAPRTLFCHLLFRQNTHTAKMGRVRTKTVKKSAKVIIERYYPKLTLDFETNKRICDEIAIIASKRLRNKV